MKVHYSFFFILFNAHTYFPYLQARCMNAADIYFPGSSNTQQIGEERPLHANTLLQIERKSKTSNNSHRRRSSLPGDEVTRNTDNTNDRHNKPAYLHYPNKNKHKNTNKIDRNNNSPSANSPHYNNTPHNDNRTLNYHNLDHSDRQSSAYHEASSSPENSQYHRNDTFRVNHVNLEYQEQARCFDLPPIPAPTPSEHSASEHETPEHEIPEHELTQKNDAISPEKIGTLRSLKNVHHSLKKQDSVQLPDSAHTPSAAVTNSSHFQHLYGKIYKPQDQEKDYVDARVITQKNKAQFRQSLNDKLDTQFLRQKNDRHGIKSDPDKHGKENIRENIRENTRENTRENIHKNHHLLNNPNPPRESAQLFDQFTHNQYNSNTDSPLFKTFIKNNNPSTTLNKLVLSGKSSNTNDQTSTVPTNHHKKQISVLTTITSTEMNSALGSRLPKYSCQKTEYSSTDEVSYGLF